MKPQLYTVVRPGAGTLSTMSRPRGDDWLADELNALAHAGVDCLVSMLTPAEEHELGLQREAALASGAGLAYVTVPTSDRGVPPLSALTAAADQAVERLLGGEHVVVHCRQGIGRASLFAAAVLVREGIDPQDAWTRLSAARGLPVPDTSEQRAFISRLLPLQ